MITGLQVVTDEHGRKVAALIGLKRHKVLWEDLQGRPRFGGHAGMKNAFRWPR